MRYSKYDENGILYLTKVPVNENIARWERISIELVKHHAIDPRYIIAKNQISEQEFAEVLNEFKDIVGM